MLKLGLMRINGRLALKYGSLNRYIAALFLNKFEIS